MEPLRRQVAHRKRRISARMRVPRSMGGVGPEDWAGGFAPCRHHCGARLSGAKSLADVSLRGEAKIDRSSRAASRRALQIFFAAGIVIAETAANRCGTNLAVVLAASRRIFCSKLSLPSRRSQ